MYTFEDLAKKFNVSVKTIRRRVKAEGIKFVDKDGQSMLFDDKALAILRDSLAATHRKHQAAFEAGKTNVRDQKNTQAEKIKIQELLIRLDETGQTLASEEYLSSIAKRVIDELKQNQEVSKIISLLNVAISRAQLIDDRYDDLTEQVEQLNNKLDNLYDKLLKNIRAFDYKQMARINAETFIKLLNKGSKGH